jgi:glycosyltransferase involved in cell wall biosynthesis
MKIAQIVCAWPPYAGGIGNSAYQIGQLLAEQNDVVNYTPTTVKPWLQYGHGAVLGSLLWRLRDCDYIYLHYPFFGTAEIVWLFKLLHKKSPQLIIHYHMDVKNLGLLAKILSLPSRGIRESLLNQADTIVTASLDYIKNSQIKKYYLAHPEKFQEIPFAVDLQKYAPKKINQPAPNPIVAYAQSLVHYVNDNFIKKHRLDLLFVGGLDRAHYFKGVEVLLAALAGLTSSAWRLTVVGEGDQRAAYEQRAADLGLADKIKFTGKLSDEDLIRAYQAADLLLLPSINSNEAFGIVLIEALACGVPVLASDLPGVRSVFANFQEGLLAEPGNAVDLRKKLEFILEHEKLRQDLALAARRLAAKKYDLPQLREKLAKLFI